MVTLTLGTVAAALSTGRSDLLALATPLLLAAVIGLTRPAPGRTQVQADVDMEKCFEGDEVEVTLVVDADDATEVEAAIAHPSALRSLDDPRPQRVHTSNSPNPSTRKFRFAVDRWGAHRIGPVATRTYGKNGLLVYDEVHPATRFLKAFPHYTWLERPLSPPDTQVYSGNYVSRKSGDGIEFSNVRPFTRGDSVKRVNWRVTSRRGTLHVNLWHPERNAEVILFIDAFDDVGRPGRSTLDLTVRGAATVARRYLRDKDRVGLTSFGGTLRWITSSMGRTQIYRITDFLLDTRASFSYVWKGVEVLPPRSLPPNAMVFAFTPLIDARFRTALADLHARGFPVVVVNTLFEEDVPSLASTEDVLAHRVWKLHRESLRWELTESGIPVINLEEESLEAGLVRLERTRGFSRAVR
jgi:uncharacterized protein (DUF58 family)